MDNWTDWKNQGTYTPFCGDLLRDLLAEIIREENTFASPFPVSSLLHAAIISCHRNSHLLEAHQFTHKRRLCTLDGLLGACSRASVVRHDTKAVGPGKLDCLTELSLEPIYEANSHT